MADILTLSPGHLGTRRVLRVHRFGPSGARPKVYIQAGLHADETPGMLVAHHLVERLARGEVRGEVIVVPAANPIGLSQVVNGTLLGRHAINGSGNFNRNFPDLAPAAAERLAGRLGSDAQANIRTVRAALRAAHAALAPATEVETLRHTLMGLAIDADIVLDLHCDQEAVVHLYTGQSLWPAVADLAARIGARAVLLADESGGSPFDEACSSVWWKLSAHFGDQIPIPPACLAATVELRGQTDVRDDLAAADAEALIRFLQGRGVVSGDPGPLPPPAGEPTPLTGADRLVTPVPGVVVFQREVGDRVEAGTVVAEIVEPGHTRTPLFAGATGVLWARSRHRFAAAGDTVASIAGPQPLTGQKSTLLTS